MGRSFRDRARSDPHLVEILGARGRILRAIRETFTGAGFVEVTTPSLLLAPDPALHLEAFRTELVLGDGRRRTLYLPTSPEHHMKRLVAGGMPRIFQIGPFFRNGEVTACHNPDFLGLEWYQAGATLEQLMADTESLVVQAARQGLGSTRIRSRGREIDLEKPFARMTVAEALSRLGGVEVPARWEEPLLREAVVRAGIPTAVDDSFDDLVQRVMLTRVEPALEALGPVSLYDFPAPMAAQARLRPETPWVAERFELYGGGLELCNGYGELTDGPQLRARLEQDREDRRRQGKHVPPLDEDYLLALAEGLPACSGCALGLDRLVMFLCDRSRIEEVMAFPMELELPGQEPPRV